MPSYTLDASNIQDLEIAPTLPEEDLVTPTAPTAPPASNAFVDPAIVSYDRHGLARQLSGLQTTVSPIMIADGVLPSPLKATPKQSLRGQSSISSIATARKPSRRDSTATATLTEPFDALGLKEQKQEQHTQATEKAEKRKSQTGPGIIDLQDVHQPLKQTKKQVGRGRGWRSTPLIEEKPKTGKRSRGRQAADDANGWATEEATDIADMGDFDFEGNHAKFDKRKVFDDIRRDDTTADEERLVSFNRNKPRPGTNGGRNLHFTENVLDVPSSKDPSRWKSEAGETEEDEIIRDEHYSSGRNSRRAGSRRPLQSRKGSVLPSHLDRKEPSPRPLTRMPTGSPLNGSISGGRASLKIAASNKTVNAISPLQMLEMEQLCTSELGLSEDMLTENAGHSIAEAILKAPHISSIQPPPEIKNVLFLLGNHKTSARALAAARHLRNRRIRVVVCMIGLERGEDHLLDIVRKQLKIYRLSLGHVERWDDYQAKLTNAAAGSIPVPSNTTPVQLPDFIVDALLGQHHTFDELRTDDQATVFSMIKWASLSASKLIAAQTAIPVMSIDVPSGVSATSGMVAEVDGLPLIMAATHVVCLSAPKIGLWVYLSTETHVPDMHIVVVDTGISLVAWQRNGSRRKQGIEFGREWVVPLKVLYS